MGEAPIMAISLKVNGASRSTPAEPDTPLVYVLRNDLFLAGAKFGCGLGQCGACTVLVDGKATRSCITPVSTVAANNITTLAGLGTPDKPHPVQTAWIEEQVNQCAYCINGWIMTAVELLARNPHPSDGEIKDALADLICRCGTHGAALRAVKRAAQQA